jgi:predicted RNA-binding protein YlqC (UPF0109 family)
LANDHCDNMAFRWLILTINNLVDDSASVRIQLKVTEQELVFSVSVAPADLGKVIGKKGHNARALRTIIHAMGRKHHVIYTLNLEQAGGAS